MSFGLKNAGATYQIAMQKIFDDMLDKNVECYVHDLVVKSKMRQDHLQDLRKIFERLRRYQLKMNPLKCAFGVTSGKFLRFIKAVKGQVLADFLANHPIPAEWELSNDLSDENVLIIKVTPPWKMYFDGASHKEGVDAGVIFITFDGEVLPYSFTLTQNCSNNVVEYQAFILDLEMAIDIKQLHLKVFGDSKLVINQLLRLYEVKKPELFPYFSYAQRLIGLLGDVEIEHMPRKITSKLTHSPNLPLLTTLEDNARVPICKNWVVPPIFDDDDCEEEEEIHAVEVFDIEREDWRQPLIDYLKYEKVPDDPRQKVDIRRRATRFIHHNDILYRRSFDGVFLCCLSDDEAIQAMEEAHSGVCGAHQSGPKLHFRIKRMGYYCLTMAKDCINYAQRCQAFASWPFDAWGLDVVRPLTKSSAGHLYILAATDYFFKWAEAVPLKEVKKVNVADFICINIIYRYGIPRYIIIDNGKPFCNSLIDKLTQKFNFKQRNPQCIMRLQID
ncbi:UNVERIFIED_CONTAM: hypothetical protein Slati_0925100 [Sesamum latifolium]|uniref:Integrase catalytic domain-containing protein n=1 Tax=Sesamum latifolium TaxID=2727402 RepID=A0AAW2XPP2_9LAMI